MQLGGNVPQMGARYPCAPLATDQVSVSNDSPLVPRLYLRIRASIKLLVWTYFHDFRSIVLWTLRPPFRGQFSPNYITKPHQSCKNRAVKKPVLFRTKAILIIIAATCSTSGLKLKGLKMTSRHDGKDSVLRLAVHSKRAYLMFGTKCARLWSAWPSAGWPKIKSSYIVLRTFRR